MLLLLIESGQGQGPTKLSCARHLRLAPSSRQNAAPPRNVGPCQHPEWDQCTSCVSSSPIPDGSVAAPKSSEWRQ